VKFGTDRTNGRKETHAEGLKIHFSHSVIRFLFLFLQALVGVALMMVFGTGTMVSAKVLLSTKAADSSGDKDEFSKTIYQSIVMFLAMFLCYPLHYIFGFFEGLYKRYGKQGTYIDDPPLTPEERKAKIKEAVRVSSSFFLFSFLTISLSHIFSSASNSGSFARFCSRTVRFTSNHCYDNRAHLH
jgi:hypothetical protein